LYQVQSLSEAFTQITTLCFVARADIEKKLSIKMLLQAIINRAPNWSRNTKGKNQSSKGEAHLLRSILLAKCYICRIHSINYTAATLICLHVNIVFFQENFQKRRIDESGHEIKITSALTSESRKLLN
jgi:hypothetical protein